MRETESPALVRQGGGYPDGYEGLGSGWDGGGWYKEPRGMVRSAL